MTTEGGVMIELLRQRLDAVVARVEREPENVEHDLWEVRRLLAAFRSSLGDEAIRIGKVLEQIEIRAATLRVTSICLDLYAQRQTLERHVAGGHVDEATDALARLRQELEVAAPTLGLTRRGQLALRELTAAVDDIEARLLSGGADRTLGLHSARARVLGDALLQRLNRGDHAGAVLAAAELEDEIARVRDALPWSREVVNAESLLARAEQETREHRDGAAVQRLIDDATGSLRWLAFAVDRKRVHDVMQARDNLVAAVAGLRQRYAMRLDARGFLVAVDDLLARADRELGAAIAREESDLGAVRARTLIRQLDVAVGLEAARLAMDLEEVAAYLGARKNRAPEVGPWLRRVEAALDRERRRRRSAVGMMVGVLNDVIYGESTLSARAAG